MSRTFLWHLGACSRFCCKELGRGRSWKLSLTLIFLVLVFPFVALANNPHVSSVGVVDQNSGSHTVKIQFNLSWDNSWRDITNYDAVWIFIKYSADSGSTWHHATLKTSGTNSAGFVRGTGTAIDIVVPNDRVGCFIQRSGNGTGTVSTDGIRLVWDYAANGLSDADARKTSTRVKVFAIEMVYIPEGNFYAGDGSQSLPANPSLAAFRQAGGANCYDPWSITSENAISVTDAEGCNASNHYYTSTGASGEDASGSAFDINASYPKGHAAFYLMKYEISEGQWAGFFNTLTPAQQAARDITAASGKNGDGVVNRNTLSWTSGNIRSTRPSRACGFLSWMDLTAYADWAGLRPMTELEFEKASRGPLAPVAGEFAWGNTSITPPAAGGISGIENGGETITTNGANALYDNVSFTGVAEAGTGPLRVGIFSTPSTTTRAAAGAGFYGNMDLSGNVWERVVSLGNARGRGFTGSHGDGTLTTAPGFEGNATNMDWPGLDATPSRGITGADGSGLKGGSWASTDAARLAVSDRDQAANADTTRAADYGGRCARTAP